MRTPLVVKNGNFARAIKTVKVRHKCHVQEERGYDFLVSLPGDLEALNLRACRFVRQPSESMSASRLFQFIKVSDSRWPSAPMSGKICPIY